MFSLIASPLGVFFALCAGALFITRFRRGRAAAVFVALAACWLWVASTPATATWLTASLQTEFPPRAVASLPHAPAAVVLGGAIRSPTPDLPLARLTRSSDRIWHAARLYHAGKARLLILSGGTNPLMNTTSEAQAMRTFLLDLGIPEGAMVLEERSRTTLQNAEFTARLLRERGIERILLVTSATHMARAKKAFEAQGIAVEPAAADHDSTRATSEWPWLPSAAALEETSRAFKEWVGRIAI